MVQCNLEKTERGFAAEPRAGIPQRRLVRMTPPQFLEGERAVLSACLMDPGKLPDILESLTPEDFYHAQHRLIFAAIEELASKNQPVDLVTIPGILIKQQKLEQAGGSSYLNDDICDQFVSSANVKHYIEMVKEKAVLRRMLATCREIAAQCTAPDCEASRVQALFQKSAFELLSERETMAPQHIGSVLQDSITAIERADRDAISSGLSSLDAITGGFFRGDFTLIGARPRVGKTALASRIARHVAKKNLVLVCSLEMPSRQIGMRYLAEGTGLNLGNLRRGLVGPSDWSLIQDTVGRFSDLNLYLDETARVTAESIFNKCRQLSVKLGRRIDMVIIDYVQLMGFKGKYENQNVKLETITRGLKLLARELDLSVIGLSQLSRDLEKRDILGKDGQPGRRPQLQDLRGSGGFEQDADNILFVYRHELYTDASEWKGKAEVIVAKQRNGEEGIAKLIWHGPTTSFRDPEMRFDETGYMEAV
jgi:replicative DNA helicase